MTDYNTTLIVVRRTADGEVRTEIRGLVTPEVMLFPVDADVEEGDHLERTLPNGKTMNVVLTKVDVLQSPFGGRDLDHTEAQYRSATPQAGAKTSIRAITLVGLHPAVTAVAADLFADGHEAQAVFAAFRAIEHRVQNLTQSTRPAKSSDSGQGLMSTVFGKDFILDISTATGRNADDERVGFMFLFMGSMTALRNPRGHGSTSQDTPEEALEHLAFASLLMRRLDVAERRQDGQS